MLRANSSAIFEKALSFIPGGVNSPVRAAKGLLSPPLLVERGQGARIWDLDGHEYIDYCMSWGALILGHAHQAVVEAATGQMAKGSSFGIATALEVQIAEEIAKLFPSIERVRLVSSGTESTMTAIRLAKAYTGRTKIVKFAGHYHGHVDQLLVQAGSGAAFLGSMATSSGITSATIQETICLPFNDTAALQELFASPHASQIAAVIVEPVAANMGVVPPAAGFLQLLRALTQKIGALLIFDEVITGFRVALNGAQGLFVIEPDLTCLGKVIGGGFPVAAVGGKKEILDQLAPLGNVYQAGTLSGNPVGVAAGLVTLRALQEEGFYAALEKKAKRLADPILDIIEKKGLNASLQRVGSLMTLFLGTAKVESDADLKKLDAAWFQRLFQTLFQKGIYLSPSQNEAWFISMAHTENALDRTAGEIVSFLSGSSS